MDPAGVQCCFYFGYICGKVPIPEVYRMGFQCFKCHGYIHLHCVSCKQNDWYVPASVPANYGFSFESIIFSGSRYIVGTDRVTVLIPVLYFIPAYKK